MLVFITFIKTYWKFILPFIAVWLVYFMFVSLENERDKAVKDLEAMKTLMANQVIENATKLTEATNKQNESETKAHKQIEDLNIDKTTLTNAIKGYYDAPTHTKPVMVPNTGIVLPLPSSGSSTEAPTSTERPTTSEPISGGTCPTMEAQIKTLEDALATETVDFNRARARVDRDCLQVGCLTE